MKEIQFFVPMEEIPKRTAQQKGVRIVGGKPHFYTKKNLEDVASFYAWVFKGYRPERPLEGQIALSIVFHYPARRPHKNGQGKTTRPDVDNLAKLPIDVLTKLGFWLDDSQIISLSLGKFYSENVGVMVKIAEFDKEQQFDDKGRRIL